MVYLTSKMKKHINSFVNRKQDFVAIYDNGELRFVDDNPDKYLQKDYLCRFDVDDMFDMFYESQSSYLYIENKIEIAMEQKRKEWGISKN